MRKRPDEKIGRAVGAPGERRAQVTRAAGRVGAIPVAVLAVVLLAGCWPVARSTLPPRDCWSDPEQLAERTRALRGVDERRALDAAERLLRLAWGDDAKMTRTPQRLSAEIRRERFFYLVLVMYRGVADEAWTVATRPEPGGAGVCVQVRGQYLTDTFVFGAEPVVNVIYPATAVERERGRFVPPARPLAVDYDTFWARLEYLAGSRRNWAACAASGPHANEARGRTEFDPLCHRLADDTREPG